MGVLVETMLEKVVAKTSVSMGERQRGLSLGEREGVESLGRREKGGRPT